MRPPFQIRFCRPLAGILALAGLAILPARAQVMAPAEPAQIRKQLNQTPASTSSSAPADSGESAPQSSPAPHSRSMRHQASAGGPSAPAAPGAAAPAAAGAAPAGRRDPFTPLLGQDHGAADKTQNLPPGKAGLMVDTLRVDGIIQGPNGMIAIVENPQARVYFLREGDKLYDGTVTHIVLDAVSFHQMGTDAFGKPVDRELTKRLNPSSLGESQ
jgi:hypothetical protein